jgi:type IX secretion system PorP/SprF family membrane protein
MTKKVLLTALLLMLVRVVLAQDPQFSQFYANQVLLSPAFAGSAEGPRLALNARGQWNAIPNAYRTFAVAYDMPFFLGPTKHGAGITVMGDAAGAGVLTKYEVLLNYSYRLLINDRHIVRLGLAAGFQQATIDFMRLRFPNQYDPVKGFDPSLSNGEKYAESRFTEDITAGAVYYNKLFWLGFNANHITTPTQEFTTTNTNLNGAVLPIRYTLFTGLNLPIEDKGISVSPSVMFRSQGPFEQLDLGCYVNFMPIVFGMYYRALDNDALIGMVGIQKGNYRFGYSYDYTLSELTNAVSGGSHEISFVIEFDRLKRASRRPSVNMSCPKF